MREATRRRATQRTAPRRRRAATRAFDPKGVTEIRRALGALMGKPRASREVLARLLDVVPATIYNWEHGTEPTAKCQKRLADLKRAVEAGSLRLTSKGLSRRPSAESVPVAGNLPALQAEEALPLYANDVAVFAAESEVWIRFSLKQPGNGDSRLVSHLVVPTSVLEALRGAGSR